MKDAVKYSLNQFRVIKFFYENYPKAEWKICYFNNPFSLEYMTFLLLRKNQEMYNPFSDDGLAKNLREVLKKDFPDFSLKEEFYHDRDYDQEFLLRFLISLGYDHPIDKKLRELYNPFTKEKITLHYDENNQPYLIVDGKRQYKNKIGEVAQ